MSKKSDDEDILEEAKRRFKEGEEADNHNRNDALEDLKFAWNLNDCQWDAYAKEVRGQRPCLVENRLPQFLSMVVNQQRANRPSIKVSPADGKASYEIAQVYEGLVRHIEQWSKADLAYDLAYEFAVSASIGYFRITTEYVDDESFEQELCIRPIDNPFTVIDDPRYQLPDGSDRKWCFVSEMVDREAFKDKYGFEPTQFEEAPAGDRDEGWCTDKQVRVAEYWRVTSKTEEITEEVGDGVAAEVGEEITAPGPLLPGDTAPPAPKKPRTREVERKKVEQFLVTSDKVIKKSDWAGIYIPVIPVLGKTTNIEGKKLRKSLIRDAKDAQRINNYFLSAETEAVALQPKAPWIGPAGAFVTDGKKWANSNIANHAFMQYDGEVPPQRVAPPAFPAALRETRMAAIESMKAIMGIYDASLGARSNETSGIAIQSRQQQGDMSTYHFLDNMTRAIRYAGLVLIDLIPKIYDTQRVVRLISPEGEAAMAAVNTIFGENQLDVGRYDVVVKAGPSFATQREEASALMVDMMKAFPPLGQIAGDLILKNMDFPGAEEMSKRMAQQIQKAQGQLPPQVQQMMQQGQQMIGQLKEALQACQQELAKSQIDGQKKEVAVQAEKLKATEAQMQLRMNESATPDAVKYEQELIHTEHLERIKADAKIYAEREVALIKAGIGLLESQFQASIAPQVPQAAPPGEMPVGNGVNGAEVPAAPPTPPMDANALQEVIASLRDAMAAPREIVRGPDGRAMGVRSVMPQPPPAAIQ